MEQALRAKRPRSVVLFEALGLVHAAIAALWDFDNLTVLDLIGFGIGAAFILWISRGRSWLGRTIYTILTAIVVAYLVSEQFTYPNLIGLLAALAFPAVLLTLVWSRSTTQWIDAKDSP